MGEALAGQVRVQQRRDDADPREPEPERDELGPVLHRERDDVAALQALGEGPGRDAIREGVELGPGEPRVLADQGDLVTPRREMRGEEIGEVGRPVAAQLAHADQRRGEHAHDREVGAKTVEHGGGPRSGRSICHADAPDDQILGAIPPYGCTAAGAVASVGAGLAAAPFA
jgi:hypothetical protein